jgi:5-methylcytosine-specific restriction endonuclease McrA
MTQKRTLVPRTRAGGKWTEARYWGFIRSALRDANRKFPPRYAAKAAAKKTVIGHRHRFEFQCAECTEWFKDKEVQVDHIIPAGTLRKYDDLPQFVENMFCEADGLQVLCKPCHQLKTNAEREQRKSND